MTRFTATFLLGFIALSATAPGALAAPLARADASAICSKVSVCKRISKLGNNLDQKSPLGKVIADSGMSKDDFIRKNCAHDGLESLFPAVFGSSSSAAPPASTPAAPKPEEQKQEQPAPPKEEQPAPAPKKEEQPAPPKNEPAPAPPTGAGGSGASNSDQQQYLDIHNQLRAKHGAAPLTWDDGLAAKAQAWANQCKFEHSGSGENLASGTGSYGIADALGSWAAEEPQYNAGSNSGAGHYTQMIWKDSKKVGCALAPSCNGMFDASFGPAKFVVCEYDPAGNVIGQHDQNIQ